MPRPRIDFDCDIVKDNGVPFTTGFREPSDLTLKEFRVEISNKHHLKGLVSFHLSPSNHPIQSLTMTLGEIHQRWPGQKLVARNDLTKRVAEGGYGTGGMARAGANGHGATADGGIGTGGYIDKDGAEGGRGVGGDAKGDEGQGGDGYGGVVQNPGGDNIAGRGTGGSMQRSS